MSQCHPCAINYDYIIKLETIYEDIQARFYWLGNEYTDWIGNEPELNLRLVRGMNT